MSPFTSPALEARDMPKYIFVTGGVVSSVGKGITTASIGRLIKARGMSVAIMKLDPYLNVDAGTLNPAEHGECFVTKDGAETDLDLGHYERYLDIELTQKNATLSGRLLHDLIADERAGKFLGKTVQLVPHLTTAIQDAIGRIRQLKEELESVRAQVERETDLEAAAHVAGAEIGPVMRIPDALREIDMASRSRFSLLWGDPSAPGDEVQYEPARWAARALARARGLPAVTLSTFREIPWNAPFYAAYGFRDWPEDEAPATVRQALMNERAKGLPDRCAMVMDL